MANKLMYIPNDENKITPSVDYYGWNVKWTLNLMNQPIKIQTC